MQATASLVDVTFKCGEIVLFSGPIPMLPQEGDSVELSGVRGFVSRLTLSYTQKDGMSIIAFVSKSE